MPARLACCATQITRTPTQPCCIAGAGVEASAALPGLELGPRGSGAQPAAESGSAEANAAGCGLEVPPLPGSAGALSCELAGAGVWLLCIGWDATMLPVAGFGVAMLPDTAAGGLVSAAARSRAFAGCLSHESSKLVGRGLLNEVCRAWLGASSLPGALAQPCACRLTLPRGQGVAVPAAAASPCRCVPVLSEAWQEAQSNRTPGRVLSPVAVNVPAGLLSTRTLPGRPGTLQAGSQRGAVLVSASEAPARAQ